MSNMSLRDAIESVCKETLAKMNFTEEQMWEMSVRISEMMMTDTSKDMLRKIKDEANNGVPNDLEHAYHKIFLSGYQCGMADEQRKESIL